MNSEGQMVKKDKVNIIIAVTVLVTGFVGMIAGCGPQVKGERLQLQPGMPNTVTTENGRTYPTLKGKYEVDFWYIWRGQAMGNAKITQNGEYFRIDITTPLRPALVYGELNQDGTVGNSYVRRTDGNFDGLPVNGPGYGLDIDTTIRYADENKVDSIYMENPCFRMTFRPKAE